MLQLALRASPVLLVAFMVVAGMPATAQSEAGMEFLGVYADTPTVGFLRPSVAVDNPLAKKISVCDNVCPVAAATKFAEATNPTGADVKMVGDMVGTVWVSTNVAQLPIKGVSITLRGSNGWTVTADGGAGSTEAPTVKGDGSLVVIGAAPTKFTFSAAPTTTTIKADAKLSVEVQVVSAGVGRPNAAVPDGTSPANIFVHYGSPEFATGVVFPINGAAGDQRIGCALPISLAADGLAFSMPTATESLARVITGNVTVPRVHNALPTAEFEWGRATLDQAITILTDASFSVTVKAPTGTSAEPYFGITANLYFGPGKVNGSSQVLLPPMVLSSTSPPGTAQTVVKIALPTAGLTVDAGRTVIVGLQVYSTNSPSGAAAALPGLQVLYGSTTDPSGFLMAVQSDDCSGAVVATPPAAEPEPEPEAEPLDDETTDTTDDETVVEDEPETVVDGEDAGTALEANVKDVSVPVDVPAPSFVFALLAGLALALVARRRRA